MEFVMRIKWKNTILAFMSKQKKLEEEIKIQWDYS